MVCSILGVETRGNLKNYIIWKLVAPSKWIDGICYTLASVYMFLSYMSICQPFHLYGLKSLQRKFKWNVYFSLPSQWITIQQSKNIYWKYLENYLISEFLFVEWSALHWTVEFFVVHFTLMLGYIPSSSLTLSIFCVINSSFG